MTWSGGSQLQPYVCMPLHLSAHVSAHGGEVIRCFAGEWRARPQPRPLMIRTPVIITAASQRWIFANLRGEECRRPRVMSLADPGVSRTTLRVRLLMQLLT
ncbi:unnamed protein product [Strongylus vulgaris]|uniref:Uncharacterized protein n=1 Tax=Strongylus vulgaris TaxID=40348 RepID=A0A3P7IUH7_STRVU|nr:unnamed protein product [Strongylus vulgaris]